jgi:signal transduction histidine kinase
MSMGERLVRRTGLGLAVFTLALIAILTAAVGFVTAAATVETANQSVDRNLQAAADNMIAALEAAPAASPEPSPTDTPTPTATSSPEESGDDSDGDDNSGPGSDNSGSGSDNSGSGGDNSGSGGDDDDRTPRPARTARPARDQTPLPSPLPAAPAAAGPTATATPVPEDRTVPSSETFFLVLDQSGDVSANPQRVTLDGLPDAEAFGVALSGNEDWRTITADGRRIRLYSQPIEGVDGGALGVLQSGFDLTRQDQQTADLVRTIVMTMLIGMLGAALVTLFVTRRAMAPIRSAFDSERRFVAAASHELRTPVAVVRASAEILQREDLVRPEGRKLVEDVVSESDRLGRLVGDLLALASAEAGQISINPTVFDLRPLVDEVVGRVAGMASDRDVRVDSVQEGAGESRARELYVNADRERMLQLLMIFIDNAIDHSPPSGVVRVVAREADEGNRQRVVVDVLDQGPGVPLEERERIFEPFAKVSGRRRSTGSTGLGLAIAQILAARQDATLAVRDAPGGGACFSVSLPRRPGPAQDPPPVRQLA